jgi:hypothetical protein
MTIEQAKWYLSDFSNTTINSDFIEAVNTILAYTKELEKKIEMLEETKESQYGRKEGL